MKFIINETNRESTRLPLKLDSTKSLSGCLPG